MKNAVPKSILERLNKLKTLINQYRYDYHVLDKETISPAALDSLKEELVQIEKQYPELVTNDSPSQRVAGQALPSFKKVKHKVTQWSFNDAFNESDIQAFHDRQVKMIAEAKANRMLSADAPDIPSYVCELKIDGLKIVLEYVDGVLATAATRGDGIVGEDVTHNVRTIQSVPLSIVEYAEAHTLPKNIIVEGEVWMTKKGLEQLNEERKKQDEQVFANPRNAAAGSIRQLDPSIAASRPLDTFIYDIAQYMDNGKEITPDTQYKELQLIQDLGFKVNPHRKHVHSVKEIISYWNTWKKAKDNLEYQLDGVVIKVNERELQQAIGYTGKAPRFGIAFKFPAEQVTTILRSVSYQVGRTGVITPVAHVDPVLVAGSTVSRATLHNEDEIRRLDIRIGDTVILEKAGDVIPKIVSVLTELRTGKEKEIIFPTHVAGCGGDGRIERIPGQAAWRCSVLDSLEQRKRQLHHFVSRTALNFDGVGEKNIDQFLEHELISDAADIFEITKDDLLSLPRFKEKSAQNVIDAIASARHTELYRVLIGLSIPHIGEESAILLAQHFKTMHALMKAPQDNIVSIHGFGDVMSTSFIEWRNNKNNIDLVQKLVDRLDISNSEYRDPHASTVGTTHAGEQKKLSGKTFVITGTLSIPRDDLKKMVRQHGGIVSTSISQSTHYLIAGDDAGSKYKKAEQLGIPIITEDQFRNMIA